MPSIIASNTQKPFKQVPAGCHFALCNMVVDLGWQKSEWQGQTRHVHQVYIRWEVPDERVVYEKDGEPIEGPCSIGRTYTLALTPRAHLRKDLENWRGKAFTAEEEKSFDIATVGGKCCQLMVTHKEGGERTYANITGVIGLTKEQLTRAKTARSEVGVLVFSLVDPDQQVLQKLPKWIQEKLENRVVTSVPAQAWPGSENEEEFDDDLPF